MTDDIIQQAREVLDRRRKLAVVAQDGDVYSFEEVGTQGTGILWRDFEFFGDQHELVAENVSEGDAALMRLVLHPDLLDAIDMAFVALLNEDPLVSTVTSQCVENIAAAIVAADERMQQ